MRLRRRLSWRRSVWEGHGEEPSHARGGYVFTSTECQWVWSPPPAAHYLIRCPVVASVMAWVVASELEAWCLGAY